MEVAAAETQHHEEEWVEAGVGGAVEGTRAWSLRQSVSAKGPTKVSFVSGHSLMAVASGAARGAVAPPPVKKPPLKNNRNQNTYLNIRYGVVWFPLKNHYLD